MIQGLQPVASLNPQLPYSVWTINGNTILDLSQLGFGSPFAHPLLFTIRNTLPDSSFKCSGAAVPFSTAEYTNADGNGAGLMGPYVPLVDYVDPSTLPATAPAQFSLPDKNYCGVLFSNAPSLNSPVLGTSNDCTTANTGADCVDWPNQYWSSTNAQPPNLYCTTANPLSTTIDFVATQFPTPVDTPSGPQNCGNPSNACSQIIEQPLELQGGTAWQPPLPITIVGKGFGYLPNVGLPFTLQSCGGSQSCSSNYLEISDCPSGQTCPPTAAIWDTNLNAPCQMYIANWTDTSISLVANLPVNLQDQYQQLYGLSTVLSPLSDFSPWAVPAASGCPVNIGDQLTFTVTNPKSMAQYTISNVQVNNPSTTTPF